MCLHSPSCFQSWLCLHSCFRESMCIMSIRGCCICGLRSMTWSLWLNLWHEEHPKLQPHFIDSWKALNLSHSVQFSSFFSLFTLSRCACFLFFSSRWSLSYCFWFCLICSLWSLLYWLWFWLICSLFWSLYLFFLADVNNVVMVWISSSVYTALHSDFWLKWVLSLGNWILQCLQMKQSVFSVDSFVFGSRNPFFMAKVSRICEPTWKKNDFFIVFQHKKITTPVDIPFNFANDHEF